MASGHPPNDIENLIGHRSVPQEPNWLTGDLRGYPVTLDTHVTVAAYTTAQGKPEELEVQAPLQQSDLLRPLYMEIVTNGLSSAYKKYGGGWPPFTQLAGVIEQTKYPQEVIIVGAGMAGMAAAYELQRVGHTVHILEAQERVGGRVHTYDHSDGCFKKGLYVDAGAMRLPCTPDEPNKIHFLTDYYGETKFKLKMVPFTNECDEAYLKFYNDPPIKIKDWNKAPTENLSRLWPGWDRTIRLTGANINYDTKEVTGKCTKGIKDIETYFSCTVNVVIDQLRVLLVGVDDVRQRSIIWNQWVEAWSNFPLDGFLRSTKETIQQNLPPSFQIGLDQLDQLLPWPEAAITAYTVFSYTPALDTSMVTLLRETMGLWWTPNMHHINGGMSELPKAFEKELKTKPKVTLTKGFVVTDIEYQSPPGGLHKQVIITGFYTTGSYKSCPTSFKGNAVLVTTPVNILRQLKFKPKAIGPLKGPAKTQIEHPTPSMPTQFYKAIENIWYGPSTKIMLECKTRFWEKDDIVGGFSKTNLPIGQIHYPSNAPTNGIKEGILLVYTWKSEALLFGSLGEDLAVAEAVRQISEIHPQMTTEFVKGKVKAWYNDPAQQGAYALLKPKQVQNVRWLMYPWRNVYFAGEAISFASGWIQGALESGLRAAYQFYARNESNGGQ